jgi:cysteine desulfurase/selenocysteine lyase
MQPHEMQPHETQAQQIQPHEMQPHETQARQIQPHEIQALRTATRGTNQYIHFNNAGASLPPDSTVDTVIRYLQEEAIGGGYETEASYAAQLDHVYTLIAKLINARPDEIAVVENASTGWCLAFNGIDFQPGDEVITSEMEYVTNHLGFLNVKKLHDIRLKVIPNDAEGNFDLLALEKAITGKTRLIAITHVPSSAGNILPVKEIGQIARRHNILYLVDACQSVGQLPLDVEAIGCDMLAVTGRKYLRAPRGTGFVYIRKNVQDKLRPLFFDGHSVASVSENGFTFLDSARRFELYEKSRALVLGLGAAVQYALDLGLDRIAKRIGHLAASLRSKLAAIPGVTVHDKGQYLCGIVTFSVAGMEAEKIKAALQEKKINVSIGRAASTPIYMNRHHVPAIVRASVHYFNTDQEIDTFAATLAAIVPSPAMADPAGLPSSVKGR